jgi:hypothetical protein
MNEDTFWFLAGNVNGLRAVLTALVATHPDPAAFGRKLDQLIEDQVATTTPIPVPEMFLDGQVHVTSEFQKVVRSRITRRRG